MLTKFSLLKRRADLTPEQFGEHWRHTHVRVLVEQGGHREYNRCYVQNHVLPGLDLEIGSDAFDGAAQMLPAHAGVLHSGFQEDPRYLRFVRPDEQRFLDVASCVVLYCESQPLLLNLRPGAIKWLVLLMRPPGMARADFLQAWQAHREALLRAPTDTWRPLRGITWHEVLPDAARGMAAGERDRPDQAYDGVVELGFDSLADLQEALASAAGRTLLRFDLFPWMGRCHGLVVREEPIYDQTVSPPFNGATP